MRSQPLPNLLATPYVFHRLEPVTERLATEQLPAVLDADLKTWYLNRTATILAPHLLEFYRRQVEEALTTQGLDALAPPARALLHSILKFFHVDITGIVRMTSCARYFKEGVGSRRPNWRWLMCFLELPKAKTACKAFVKRLSFSCGSSDDTTSSMTSTRHSTCTFARRLPT